MKNALMLSGGGARAAYQVGVLKAISDYFKNHLHEEDFIFDVFSGVSAGAINAIHLASKNDNYYNAINSLVSTWENFHVEHIYKTDDISLIKTAFPWIRTLLPFKRKDYHKYIPMSLLDNSPLKKLLKTLDYKNIRELIKEDKLSACSITCSSYHTGQSITFFEGNKDIPEWEKDRRQGIRTHLGVEHLLASSALPMIFPAQKIHHEWFGDGSMRQQAPLSPAIHLNANKIFVIGTGKAAQFSHHSLLNEDISLKMSHKPYPSLAQIGGHILNGLFVDSLYADIDRLNRTNEIIRRLGKTEDLNIRKIDLYIVNPSKRIDEVASQFVHELPKSILRLLSRIGVTERFGGGLASYLLFEKSYCKELIEIGYSDAWHQRKEIANFLLSN